MISRHLEEGSSKSTSQGWSHLFPHVLDGVRRAMAEHEAIVFLQCGRLVNRHWCQWATQATKVLAVTIDEYFDEEKLPKLREYFPGRDFRRRTEGLVNCFSALESLTLTDMKAADLQPLQRLPRLRHLKLIDDVECQWGQWGVAEFRLMHVAAMTGLVSLEFLLCDITDQGVGQLVSLVCLEKLGLQRCYRITDASLSTIALLPALTDVNLKDCSHISDVGIVRLAKLTGLAKLMLGNTDGFEDRFSNEGARVLGTMTNLVALDVGCSYHMSDSGVEHLKSLTKLTHLSLPANTSDTTLRSLRSLTGISHLRFHGGEEVTNRGLSWLTQLCKLSRLELAPSNEGLKLIAEVTRLVSLNLSVWTRIDRDITIDGIQRLTTLTNLTTLRFSLEWMTDKGVMVFSALTGLKNLNLNGCERITMVGLRWISRLTRLTDLSLCACGEVAKSFDGQFLGNLQCLTKLALAHNDELTEEGLRTLTRLTNLAALDLRYCTNITRRGLWHLAPLRFLTCVEFEGCPALRSLARPYFLCKWV
ncbi:unnamed protein product [Ostreobium quekettii]|uniref:Uncharacterized protein n=1 Tax=Ostreobium quekettii TaxID=121088 RepID=A0A8S1IZT9_9CHLO|nr:unnamed protein product [Ostreobium quekettii]|eukprot:evm.model.scf_1185.2 EVM.evm.TU.scf_1185.2   scf_1185:38868-40796(-)